MDPIERALEIARTATGKQPKRSGSAMRVRRLDRPGTHYYLVVLEGAVVAVDISQDQPLAWAEAPEPQLPVDEQQARELARLGPSATAELAWRSSTATRSPLYPLWEIREEDEVAYVDQQGNVWPALDISGRGG